MELSAFHFIRPYWLLALLPLGYLFWRLVTSGQRDNAWRQVCDAHLLPHLLLGNAQRQTTLPLVLVGVGWLIAVLALAGPTWSKQPQPVFRKHQARVIVVDLSNNMLGSDIKPDRITRARYKIRDILDLHQEGLIGMVAFAGEAYVVAPLTEDGKTIAAMLLELHPDIMPLQGNNIALGIAKAQTLLEQGGASTGEVILFTASPVSGSSLSAAKKLAHQGYTLSIIGIGTQDGAPIPGTRGFEQQGGQIIMAKLDKKALKTLANAGGGVFTPITNNDRDLKYLFSAQQQTIALHASETKNVTDRWYDAGQWLILLLLPIVAVGFRRGWFEELI